MTLFQQTDLRGAGDRPLRMPAAVEGRVYSRLKGVVMLCGAVRRSILMEGVNGCLLELPLNAKEKVLDRWIRETEELAVSRSLESLPLKVMLDAQSEVPKDRAGTKQVGVTIERDPFEYRGTGGVLHDVSRTLGDEDFLIVVSGVQLLMRPLKELVHTLATAGAALGGGDVTVLGQPDGTPSGLMLIRCGVLRGISELGFVDLKEQALPAIAKKFRVVVEQRELVTVPIRTARDYLCALRDDHRRQRGEELCQDPFAEDWHSEFAVVEPGAEVDPSARLFDSVVLPGATVGANAVLVRTVVCPGGRVKSGERLVDHVVTREGRKLAGNATRGGVR